VNLQRRDVVANVDLATLQEIVKQDETMLGPLVAIYGDSGQSAFLYDVDPGPVDDDKVVTLQLSTAPALMGQHLVCQGTAFISNSLQALSAFRPNGTPTQLDLSTISLSRADIAALIVSGFSQLSIIHQAAALANAIAESGLNPTARNTTGGEDSVGLFQLNRNGGEGTGHAVEELEDPIKNIDIVFSKVKNIGDFTTAQTLDDAVAAFVRKFERPNDPNTAITQRQAIGHRLLRA
jgi:hypothetical protein